MNIRVLGFLAEYQHLGLGWVGCLVSVWVQRADFWDIGAGFRMGLSPSHAWRPSQGARPSLGQWEIRPRTRLAHGRPR